MHVTCACALAPRAARGDLWPDSGPAEVLDSMKYKGEHLEILLTLNRSVGLIRADTRHPPGPACRAHGGRAHGGRANRAGWCRQ